MTGLDTDFAQSATIKRVADLSDEKPEMAQGVGSDYPRNEKALLEYREKVKTDPAGVSPSAGGNAKSSWCRVCKDEAPEGG